MNNVLMIDSTTDGYRFDFPKEVMDSNAIILMLITEQITYVFDLQRTKMFLLEENTRSLALNICISKKLLMAKIGKGDYK